MYSRNLYNERQFHARECSRSGELGAIVHVERIIKPAKENERKSKQ